MVDPRISNFPNEYIYIICASTIETDKGVYRRPRYAVPFIRPSVYQVRLKVQADWDVLSIPIHNNTEDNAKNIFPNSFFLSTARLLGLKFLIQNSVNRSCLLEEKQNCIMK